MLTERTVRTLLASSVLRAGKCIAAGEVDSALFIVAEELDSHSVADLADILDLFHAAVIELGYMNKSLLVRCYLDECADRDNPRYLTGIDSAYLRLKDYALDDLLCLERAVAVDCCNEYGAVIAPVSATIF